MYPEGRGEVMGVQTPVESSICFSIVYAQKYCTSSAPVFMKFKNFLQVNVKVCTLFSHFASVYWLCPRTQLRNFYPPDALDPPILDNSWSTSCETPPLRSPGRHTPMVQPIPISIPSGLLAVAPQTHWGNVRSPHVGCCSSCYVHKIISWIFSSKRHQCHQNCCLNKPYFYVKNAPNTQQCQYQGIGYYH